MPASISPAPANGRNPPADGSAPSQRGEPLRRAGRHHGLCGQQKEEHHEHAVAQVLARGLRPEQRDPGGPVSSSLQPRTPAEQQKHAGQRQEPPGHGSSPRERMIPKSVQRFSDKIMRKQRVGNQRRLAASSTPAPAIRIAPETRSAISCTRPDSAARARAKSRRYAEMADAVVCEPVSLSVSLITGNKQGCRKFFGLF